MLGFFWQRLDQSARLTLPFTTAVIFVVLSAIAWPLPYLGTVAPPLALVAVYYWAIYRPDLFRPGMAFVIGLINDVVHFLPIGLSALIFVAAHQLVWRQRRFFAGHSFFMLWWGFALTTLVAMLAAWLLQMLLRWQAFPFGPVLWQALFAIAIFPLPCWVLIRLQRAVLSG
jgi:rod shape-determining protein MreD